MTRPFSLHYRAGGIFIVGLVLAAVLMQTVGAQSVPSLVNYQGRLSNPDGSPLATADYQLSFSIYDATNGGNLIWGPQIFDGTNGHGLKIPVVQGYFNVMLGPADTNGTSLANAFTNATSFVQITVGTNQPILPRQRILTSPYAFQAGNAAKLAGADWSAVFGTNDPVNGKILAAKLSDPFVVGSLTVQGGTRLTWSQSGTGADRWLFFGASSEGHHMLNLSDQPGPGTGAGLNVSGVLVADDFSYASPGPNTLIVKGGVGIGKTNPATALDVNGAVTATAFAGNGAGLTSLNGTNLSDGTIPISKLSSRQTGANVGAGGLAMSIGSGVQDLSGNGDFTVANLVVTISTTGRPVFVGLINDTNTTGSSTSAYIEGQQASGNGTSFYPEFLRDSVVIASYKARNVAGGANSVFVGLPVSAFYTIDVPAPGNHTYTFRVNLSTFVEVSNCRLIAFEL